MPAAKGKNYSPTLTAQLRKLTHQVFDRMKLTQDERMAAWAPAMVHPTRALTCYKAISNSYTDEGEKHGIHRQNGRHTGAD